MKSFADAKLLLVIIFTCSHCATAQAYEQRIKDHHADYQIKGVALVAILPNDPKAVRLDKLGYTEGDSLEYIKFRAKDQKFTFPYHYDGDKQDEKESRHPRCNDSRIKEIGQRSLAACG